MAVGMGMGPRAMVNQSINPPSELSSWSRFSPVSNCVAHHKSSRPHKHIFCHSESPFHHRSHHILTSPLFLFTSLVLLVLLSPSLPTPTLVYLASLSHSTAFHGITPVTACTPSTTTTSSSQHPSSLLVCCVQGLLHHHRPRNPLLTIHPTSLVSSIHVADIIVTFYRSF
jgi:hypothetical protein